MMAATTPHRRGPGISLSVGQYVKLADLMRVEYKSSGLFDPAFAALATERLGFLVKDTHVQLARRELAIEANRKMAPAGEAKRNASAPKLLQRVAALEKELRTVLDRINALERYEFAQYEQ